MSYEKNTWANGDVITAAKLNKMENGIANAGNAMIVTGSLVNDNYVLNKTVQELYDATVAGIPVYLVYIYGDEELGPNKFSANSLCYMYTVYEYNDSTYRVGFTRMAGTTGSYYPKLGSWIFGAASVDAYPVSLHLIEYD